MGGFTTSSSYTASAASASDQSERHHPPQIHARQQSAINHTMGSQSPSSTPQHRLIALPQPHAIRRSRRRQQTTARVRALPRSNAASSESSSTAGDGFSGSSGRPCSSAACSCRGSPQMYSRTTCGDSHAAVNTRCSEQQRDRQSRAIDGLQVTPFRKAGCTRRRALPDMNASHKQLR